MDTLRQWRHYPEGANHKILIQCDHKNVEYFQTSKVLSRRQARWAETLSSYDFVVQHLEGERSPADAPSRRPDYDEGYERPTARLLATLVVTTVEPFSDLLPVIKAAQNTDPLATDMKNKIGGQDGSKNQDTDMQWKVSAGALTFEGRIYVAEALRNKVISLFHNNPESGHSGALRTAELVSRDLYWLALDTTVRKDVAGCTVCHRIIAPRHVRYEANIPLPPPYHPWHRVTMDYVTNLPESTKSGYTSILAIVDQLTKMAIYLPCRKEIESPELACMFFEHVICKHGVPNNFITDGGTQFTSRLWTRVCCLMSIDHRLSTAFYPQTNGQTERQNWTMEQYLRAFSNYEQDNWAELIPLSEFGYNNSVHASTRMIPFLAMYHHNPEMQFKGPKASHLNSEG